MPIVVPELATGSFNFVWQSKLTNVACHVSSFMMAVDASSVRQTCSVLEYMFVTSTCCYGCSSGRTNQVQDI